MKLHQEYRHEIDNKFCNLTEPHHMVRNARLIASITESGYERSALTFRIEENARFDIKFKKNYTMSHHSVCQDTRSYGPWVVLGEKSWTVSSKLPSNVSPQEFYRALTLMSGYGASAGSVIMQYFNELEVVPAYEGSYEGKDSWIKAIMPAWFDHLLENEKTLRGWTLSQIHEETA